MLTWLAVISVMPGITRSVLGSRIQLSHSSGYAHIVKLPESSTNLLFFLTVHGGVAIIKY